MICSVATIVRALSILLTLAGAYYGIRAARLWREASQISPDPGWSVEHMEPVDETLKQMDMNVAFIEQMQHSGTLNKSAAKLTARALLLGATGSIVGLFVPS